MNEQVAIQQKLQNCFAELKAKNPSYTLRAFSKKLGLNSGAVSAIIAGKRRVSAKFTAKVLDRLCIDPQVRAEVLSLFPKKNSHKTQNEKLEINRYLQLSADQFQIMSEWYHFAILSLLNTKNFQNDTSWIAERLGLSERKIKEACEKLFRLGLLIEDKTGAWKRGALRYRTTDEISSSALRKAHAQNLELAHASLEQDAINARDFSAITMAIDPSKLKQAKALIRQFQDQLAELLEAGDRTEIYKFCTQLIPLTKKGANK